MDLSESQSNKVEEIIATIQGDESLAQICLPRKEWRKKWNGKEIRLNTEKYGMLGFEPKLAFVKTEEEIEDEDEDVDFDNEDEDEEEDDDEEDEEEDDEDDDE